MTEQDNAEYERAQALLREAKPSWLQRMAPESPLAPVPIPERQAKFDMGITPIALDGGAGGGEGGAVGGATIRVAAAKQLSEGVFTVALLDVVATEAE